MSLNGSIGVLAGQAFCWVILEAQTWAREEFGGLVGLNKLWYTILRLRKGKQCSTNNVHSVGGVGRWKDYSSTAKASSEEAETDASGEDSSITRTSNLLGVDEILPKYLKSLDVQRLSWLSPSQDWQTGMAVPLLQKGVWRLCSNPLLQHSSGKSTLGYWYVFKSKQGHCSLPEKGSLPSLGR